MDAICRWPTARRCACAWSGRSGTSTPNILGALKLPTDWTASVRAAAATGPTAGINGTRDCNAGGQATPGRNPETEESMNSARRNFLLLMTLASMTAVPLFAQPKESTSIPDLSGIWNHSIPGFEPLASGPTALVNRSRRPNGTGNILKLVGDYTNPILKPYAAEIVKKHGEIALMGIGDPNPRNQ